MFCGRFFAYLLLGSLYGFFLKLGYVLDISFIVHASTYENPNMYVGVILDNACYVVIQFYLLLILTFTVLNIGPPPIFWGVPGANPF